MLLASCILSKSFCLTCRIQVCERYQSYIKWDLTTQTMKLGLQVSFGCADVLLLHVKCWHDSWILLGILLSDIKLCSQSPNGIFYSNVRNY
jgi:hypothetical protein